MNYFQFLSRFPHKKPNAFIYAVSGKYENYRMDLIKRIRSRHRPGDLDYVTINTKSGLQALSSLSQSPMGTYRFIEISDFIHWYEDHLISDWLQRNKYPKTIVLFISDRKPSTDNLFAQFVIKYGWWVVCNSPNPEQVGDYLCKTYNLSPDRDWETNYRSRVCDQK